MEEHGDETPRPSESRSPADPIYEGLFTIDVDADPHRIDIEFVEGPEAGKWSYGMSDARPSGVDGGQRTTSGVHATVPAPAIDESAFAQAMTPLLRRLQGEWTPLALVTNGTPLAANLLAFGSRTMAGNEMKVVFGGQTMVHARIRLDESVTPIAVDYLNIGRGRKAVHTGSSSGPVTRRGSAWRRPARRGPTTSRVMPAADAR